MAIKHVFRGTLQVQREFSTNSPESLQDAMASFATLQGEVKKLGFSMVVPPQSRTAKLKTLDDQTADQGEKMPPAPNFLKR